MTYQELKQAVFDRVWAGAEAQGWQRSMVDSATCAFRGEGGRKCHIGHLIPDGLYDPVIEGSTLPDDIFAMGYPDPDLVAAYDELTEEQRIDFDAFLHDLQAAHDGARTPERMRDLTLMAGQHYGVST